MIRSFRYPLRPTQAQAEVLTHWLGMCCDLYNGALEERRTAWRKQHRSVGLFDQTKALTEVRTTVPGWHDVPCEVARSALRRLDQSMKAFFARVKRGTKPGFPRFRSRRLYDSFNLQKPARVNGDRIILPKLGPVKFYQYRPLVGKVLDVIVRREADRWWVTFKCDVGAAPAKPTPETIHDHRMVGVDVGLTSLATLSTGEQVANPRHGREAAKKLAAAQRCLARKQKGSRSRRRALIQVQRAHIHIANQRKDTAYKTAAMLVRRFDLICFEDLTIRQMVHGNLANSIYDAAWGELVTAVEHKAESAGAHVVKVNPSGTSQRCSGCGATVRKSLADRVHDCPGCGLVLDRDHNAALNILALGRSALGLSATPPITGEGLPVRLVA